MLSMKEGVLAGASVCAPPIWPTMPSSWPERRPVTMDVTVTVSPNEGSRRAPIFTLALESNVSVIPSPTLMASPRDRLVPPAMCTSAPFAPS